MSPSPDAEPSAISPLSADPALVWCPFASEADAARAAGVLLDEGLIACANILGPMRALFIWNGERGEAIETGVLFKTSTALLDIAVARLTHIHPYDEPAVIGWRADAAPDATRSWLGALAAAPVHRSAETRQAHTDHTGP